MYGRYDKIICISEIAEERLREYLGTQIPQISQIENGSDNVNEDEARRRLSIVNYQLSIKRSYNICTINNGVDVEAIHGAEPIAEMRSGKFVVVMVAGFREAKDQDTLIRAMALLPKEEYELWLVGDGMRRANLELIIDNLQLGDQVKLWGLRTDVPRILKTADVVVMSSHWEGLSLSNIEGMSAGKPFVASDVNGLREVTQGYGILFPHEDAEALAQIIRQLHDDRAFYREVAARCYERAREFDISVMVNRYNEVYSSLRR
jgi:glycosyltransferase involved in cell wall biosynthesis